MKAELTERVKAQAKAEGFDLVGVAPATPLASERLDRWVERGWDAGLWYVRESRNERLDPSLLLPGVRSVVVVAFAYDHAEPAPPPVPHGTVSRYARGRDYHNVVRRPMKRLREYLKSLDEGVGVYTSCDTRPVMEKAWAERAGLGWIGKNGLLIAPPYGSYVLLGCLFTTLELVADVPHPDRCGTCTACIPACPTNAIVEPRYVDAGKCLSYLTIENRAPMPQSVRDKLSKRLFGCDLCQEVCPWNRHPRGPSASSLGRALEQNQDRAHVTLEPFVGGSSEERQAFIQATPLARAGEEGLLRTARALLARHDDED